MTYCGGAVDDAHVGFAPAEERLLEALTEIVGHDGYAELTVERLFAAAGVSRASFYRYFANVEDCFWSAYRRHTEQLLEGVGAAARGDGPRELAVLDALVARAISNPRVARMLMCEGIAAGPQGVVERDALIAGIVGAMGGAGAQSRIDLPLAILVGGVFRFLAMRLSDGAALDCLRGEVREWAGSFVVRSAQRSWSVGFAPALPEGVDRSPAQPERVPSTGTPRERILRATAESVRERGYRAITVIDIATAAGVSRRAFYDELPGKSEAFAAAYEDTVQRTLAVCTPAFFAPGAWPERVWHGVHAATRLFGHEPSSAYLGFVESYAIGPAFAARVHDTQLAFTMFLQDGYHQRPQARSLSRACAVLTSTAIFETGFQASCHGTSLDIQRMAPLAVYIALAPFIGVDAAGEFVTSRLTAATLPQK